MLKLSCLRKKREKKNIHDFDAKKAELLEGQEAGAKNPDKEAAAPISIEDKEHADTKEVINGEFDYLVKKPPK